MENLLVIFPDTLKEHQINPKMITKTTLLPTAMLALLISGCGGPPHESAKAESALCTAIMDTNLARQCTAAGSTAAVVIESDDDEVARETCDKIASRITQVTSKLSGNWQLLIFSPYRSDKQNAACPLHQ